MCCPAFNPLQAAQVLWRAELNPLAVRGALYALKQDMCVGCRVGVGCLVCVGCGMWVTTANCLMRWNLCYWHMSAASPLNPSIPLTVRDWKLEYVFSVFYIFSRASFCFCMQNGTKKNGDEHNKAKMKQEEVQKKKKKKKDTVLTSRRSWCSLNPKKEKKEKIQTLESWKANNRIFLQRFQV